jgi:orotidine-5'-phosphate decarboxylase
LSAPIALALDAPNLATAIAWAQIVDGEISILKVGLETYLRDGLGGVRAIQEAAPNCQLFLDLKLHDIPNTVAGACRSVEKLNPAFLPIHALGGAQMVRAAAQALPGTQIAAVTVLTSMDQAALTELRLGETEELALNLAKVAVSAGARALVCSPHEVRAIRAHVGPDITLIVPGVRLPGEDVGDQKRVSTPAQALADGADLLVIGRSITGPWKTEGTIGVATALGNVLSHLRSYNN